MDKLFNLKCFSLESFYRFQQYDKIVSLLRRMSYLEKLTLYLPIKDRNRVIDGTYVQRDILDYMSLLHSFTFYICTYVETVDLSYKLTSEDIQQTLTGIGQQHAINGLMTFSSDNCQLHSIIEYPHLTILDLENADKDYVEQFLNETKAYVPCLTKLGVFVHDLKVVTKDFTREETRRNCAKANDISQI
ncbi:unnamed protein product [Rotaria sp. Silwood1]|nr:unnamed protein product [Rotaria sp. Silwood1]